MAEATEKIRPKQKRKKVKKDTHEKKRGGKTVSRYVFAGHTKGESFLLYRCYGQKRKKKKKSGINEETEKQQQ